MSQKDNSKYSYSQDWNTVTALQHELNHLTVNKKNDNVKPLIEEYMRNRIKELKDRWK